MPERLPDAASRRFLDEFESVRVSRFRAMGVVDPAKQLAVIPFPNGKSKLLGVKHTSFPNGGGWSYFVCPGCSRRAVKLWLLDDAARCVKCCYAMNIRHRNRYGFTRADRALLRDRALEALQAKLHTTERLTYKPNPPSWRGRAQLLANSQILTNALSRSMIALRLTQLAKDATSVTDATIRPKQALAMIPEVKQVWRTRTFETLAQALDNAQDIILRALDHEDPQVRLNAAKLMLNTKQGRERGFAG